MSISRQARQAAADHDVAIRTFGVTFRAKPPRAFIPPHTPGWDQLVHVSRGSMTVRAANQDWLVIAHRALWIPASVPYTIRLKDEVAMRSLYFRPSRRGRGAASHCAAFNITPLLRELILRTTELGALSRRVPVQRHLIDVIHDELLRLPAAPLQLPLPSDDRALQFAELIVGTPPSRRPPQSRLLRQAGVSQRTLERLIQTETSMSLGRWIRRNDVLLAVSLLAAGERVHAVADTLGYNSPSAFIAMFKKELGLPPAAFQAQL